MTQANLLERAKQGDPESIATLINLTLQPKGITATAKLIHQCLHVFLTSDRILNQTTMANFVRRGLQGLDVSSIQTARIYGQKIGETTPTWMEEIVINHLEDQSPTPAVAQPIAPSNHPFPLNLDHLSQKLAAWKNHLPALEAVAKQVTTQAKMYGNQYWHKAERIATQIQLPKHWSVGRFSPKKYAVTLAIATLPAFLLGAVVAIIASYANSSLDGNGGSVSVNPSTSQMAINADTEAAITKQQIEVKKYLAKMNKGQQDFYQKNNRFASSLEELERSISTISLLSTTRGYTYKLTTPDNTYSLLAAIPREDGFKSFTGVVFLDEAPNNAIRPITTICETSQPSKTPPETPRSLNGVLQCPPGSSKSP